MNQPTDSNLMSNSAGAMDAYRRELSAAGLQPLWDIMRKLAPIAPNSGGDPAHWRWDQLRGLVMRAGELITAEEADRRVIVLENPAFAGEGKATSSLYAGVQLILPGETAPSHRHTAAALRLIMHGSGAYTAVGGERAVMRPGDFIVTPSLSFHDHGNDGDEPVIWLDGLDVFVVNLLNAGFFAEFPEARQAVDRPDGDALARYGSGLLPHGFEPGQSSGGMFAWPYERTREALYALSRTGAWDPALGLRMTFIDPSTGRSPMKTLTAAMQLFPEGFSSEAYRTTSGAVMSVVEGSGRVRVGGRIFDVGPKDVFVAPSWTWIQVDPAEDLVMFGFSDEVLQRHLGYWREERGPRLKDN